MIIINLIGHSTIIFYYSVCCKIDRITSINCRSFFNYYRLCIYTDTENKICPKIKGKVEHLPRSKNKDFSVCRKESNSSGTTNHYYCTTTVHNITMCAGLKKWRCVHHQIRLCCNCRTQSTTKLHFSFLLGTEKAASLCLSEEYFATELLTSMLCR